ncbi:MAG: MiaB/RimO family radical SAM methylthiotransferase [Gemmatimonadetes bacterium]|nr:MiaB/RimO family radical SAM methylthiotransferase [Gemmatimonadota bacterium]
MMRVYLHTFGCKANQYDTEAVRQALEASGATSVGDPALADAAIVNSCTVTHVAEAKMRGLVRRLARQRPALRTVVMGCAAALDDGAIARLPGVEAVVGGAEPSRVLAALGLSAPNAGELLRSFARGSRAWLKIQDGCDEHCTFCATTLARGANRSRPVDDLVAEAGLLAEQHEEIVLTGVHIGSYGRDGDGGMTLGRLVEELVRQVPRVRFRLSSVEATEVDPSLAELMIGEPLRLAPHLHAPLQSGSDRLLKRMGRHWYTARAYRDRIEWLAERLPRLGLGADVIVGFPGETARDHAATMELVSALPFTYLHVFPYSERPGASARRLGRPVDPPVAAARSAELRDLAASHRQRYQASRDGGPADVVLMARQAARFQGLTEDYLTVYLPADRARPPRLPATLRRRGGVLLAEAA